MRPFLVLGALISVIAPAASAQLCTGAPALRPNPVQVSAGLVHQPNVTSMSVGLTGALGGDVFGAVSAGGAFYSSGGADASSFVAGATLGYAFPLSPTRKAFLCPTLGASYEVGPDAGDIDIRSFGVGPALAVGGEVPLRPTVSLVPWTAAQFVYARTKLTAPFNVISDSDTYGVLAVGASLMLRGRLTLGPRVSIPLGVEGADPAYGVAVTIGFGGRR